MDIQRWMGHTGRSMRRSVNEIRRGNPRGVNLEPYIQLLGAVAGLGAVYEIGVNGLARGDCTSIGGQIVCSLTTLMKLNNYACKKGSCGGTVGNGQLVGVGGSKGGNSGGGNSGGGNSGGGNSGGGNSGGGCPAGGPLLSGPGFIIFSCDQPRPSGGFNNTYPQNGYFDSNGNHISDGWVYQVYAMNDGSFQLFQMLNASTGQKPCQCA